VQAAQDALGDRVVRPLAVPLALAVAAAEVHAEDHVVGEAGDELVVRVDRTPAVDDRVVAAAAQDLEGGLVGVKLPERSDAAMRARMTRQHAEARETAPPQEIEAAIADIRRLLDGHKQDLSRIDLDMSAVPDFEQRVYAETRSIPPGETLTYGDIATRLGDVGLSRAVGQALGRNPFAVVVPCHRVLAAGGKSGGFSAVGGVDTKRRLLEIEGARDLHPTLPWDPIR